MNLTKVIKKEILITASVVIAVVITFFGVSYAIDFSIDNKNVGTVSFGQLTFDMCADESCNTGGTTYGTTITSNVYPMNTEEGTSQTPYLFKISNNGSTAMDVKVYVARGTGSTADYENVVVATRIQGTSAFTYTNITGADTAVVLDTTLTAGQNKILELYMWVDEEAENDMIGKTVMLFVNSIGYYKPDDPDNVYTTDTYIANITGPEVKGKIYGYTGDYQEFEARFSGYYFIEAYGAQGGVGYYSTQPTPGLGSYVSGYLYLAEGEKLYIYVGGKGGNATSATSIATAGYNGGGSGNKSSDGDDAAGAGGGATDIRYFGDTTPTDSDLLWNSMLGLNSRIMVAAGGGGSHSTNVTSYREGMDGGTLAIYGMLSTWTSTWTPFVGPREGNAFGIGAAGLNTTHAGAGGGGGYYGGVNTTISTYSGRASGGSSFMSGYAGVNAITASDDRTHTDNTLHYSGKYFLAGKMESGVREGNGQASIKYVGLLERTNTKLNNVRYIKDCIDGSTINVYNNWVEVQAIKNGVNLAKGKSVSLVSGATLTNSVKATDGKAYPNNDGNTNAWINNEGTQCLFIDLGATYDLDEIAIWHNYLDGRTFYDNVTYTSSDNSSWTETINKISVETPNGKRVNAYDEEIKTNSLPNGYQLVEYIQSSGTEYIDTEYYWNNEIIRIFFDGTVITNSTNQSFFGNEEYYNSSSRYFAGIIHGSSGSYSVYVGSGSFGTISAPVGTRVTFDVRTLSGKNLYVLKNDVKASDATSTTYSGTVLTKQNASLTSNVSTTVGNIFIFANHNSQRGANNNPIQNIGAMRLYRFKLYDNGEIVRDYVPCYRKTDNVIGLYDLVNSKFYTNKGTGAFTKGNNIATGNSNEIYSVTYNCNGGAGTAPAAAQVTYGSNATLTGNFTCGPYIVEGDGTAVGSAAGVYRQIGWSDTPTGGAIPSFTVTDDVTLYAAWEKVFTYNASYTVVDNGSGNWTTLFKATGSLVFSAQTNIDIQATGGGGGGGGVDGAQSRGGAGGGGGGATKYVTSGYNASGTIAVTIGTGGNYGSGYANGSSGGTSSFGTLVTAGGGGGGIASTWDGNTSVYGSGGTGGSTTGGSLTGITVNGASGGRGGNPSNPGINGNNGNYAFGSSTSGSVQYGAGGGGGCGQSGSSTGIGGTTGGGNGGACGSYTASGTPAIANTGSGGGGTSGGGSSDHGGLGGTGIVIIRNHR